MVLAGSFLLRHLSLACLQTAVSVDGPGMLSRQDGKGLQKSKSLPRGSNEERKSHDFKSDHLRLLAGRQSLLMKLWGSSVSAVTVTWIDRLR